MKILFYDPIDILGIGFILGFIAIFIILLIGHLTGKKIPMFKKNLLIISAILIIVYTPPLRETSKVWLLASLLILAMIINNILSNLYSLTSKIYDNHIDDIKAKKLSQLIYIISFIFGIGIIIAGSSTAVNYTYYLIKQLIVLSIGFWLAFKLLYNRCLTSETK